MINAHPGVSHNYLRNHEFNLWFTIATEPDSPLGLEGTLQALAAEAGAESVRQLPTLKLFKIRMDLEMEGDTEALAKAAVATEPIELEPQPYDETDIEVIKALQGDMPVIPEPYAPAAAQLGQDQRAFLDHLAGMQERGLLRRVAAILYHRRAGFSANGMGVWKVPEEHIHEVGRQMAAVRGISHCYQRPTYADWPYSVFTMAHGRSKEECDAVLDAIAEMTGIEERATLYSSTEYKKIRLLYFTDEFKAWEREHAGRLGDFDVGSVDPACDRNHRRGEGARGICTFFERFTIVTTFSTYYCEVLNRYITYSAFIFGSSWSSSATSNLQPVDPMPTSLTDTRSGRAIPSRAAAASRRSELSCASDAGDRARPDLH